MNPKEAFDFAIKSGTLSITPTAPNYAGRYMYMGTSRTEILFKHIDTREYVKVEIVEQTVEVILSAE